MEKRCPRCGETKELSAFAPRSDRPGKLRSHCIACRSAAHQKYNGRTKAQRKTYADQARRLTPTQFDALWALQAGNCAICHKPMRRQGQGRLKGDTAIIEHDHATGDVRSLTHNTCNTALGLMHENPADIEGLRVYALRCAAHRE